MEFTSINTMSSAASHTQYLIEKLTTHFQSTQNVPRAQLASNITQLLVKASQKVSSSSNSSPMNSYPSSPILSSESSYDISSSNSSVCFDSHPTSPMNFSSADVSEDESLIKNIEHSPADIPVEFIGAQALSSLNASNPVDIAHPQQFANGFTYNPSCSLSLSSIPFLVMEPSALSNDIHQLPSPFVENRSDVPIPPSSSVPSSRALMRKFSQEGIIDFKHLIYNLLVDNFNDPENYTFAQPITMELPNGVTRRGFKFNILENPEKRLPELYAKHIRKADLQKENHSSPFIQDLYKYYLRACVELLSKYFIKHDRHTFLYDDVPLFIAGGSLEEAEYRMSKMGTIQRRQKKRNSMNISAESAGISIGSHSDSPRKRSKNC